jgi:tRNA G10  N-methylase Trm11
LKHPATFNDGILAAMDRMLPEAGIVLDPFAGVGGIHDLALPTRDTIGIEIEPEWADAHAFTEVGNALELPFADGYFDAIATSPAYGNRMADSYDGRDGSKRATYRIALGHPLHPENGGGMQWGDSYRDFHALAWDEAYRVLKPGGTFVLNCKDHVRKGERQHVTDWHVTQLTSIGLLLIERQRVPSPGNRYGANGSSRIDYEEVVRLDKPRRCS